MPNDRHAIVARSVQTEPPEACYMQTDEVVELPGLPPRSAAICEGPRWLIGEWRASQRVAGGRSCGERVCGRMGRHKRSRIPLAVHRALVAFWMPLTLPGSRSEEYPALFSTTHGQSDIGAPGTVAPRAPHEILLHRCVIGSVISIVRSLPLAGCWILTHARRLLVGST